MKVIAVPIEMISWTEKNGTIHPIRFQLEDENKEKKVIKILRTYKIDKEKLAGNLVYKFTCEILINGILRICEIKYYLEKCTWILFKL